MYNIVWGPCTKTQIVKAPQQKKVCLPLRRPHPLTSDPEEFDPRPPLVSGVTNPCCDCRPRAPQIKSKGFDLKLKLLQDCYDCRLSSKYHDRRKSFYERWQLYLDNLPRRYPNYDYKVYCCDDYVDLSQNKDFVKYSYFKPNKPGQRDRHRRNFMFPQALFQAQEEQECMRNAVKPLEYCPDTTICDPRQDSCYAEAKFNLHHNEPLSIWHEKILGPRRHVEGATLMKSRLCPFHRDASFSTPLCEFATGNDPPFKEIRDVKVSM